MTEILNRIDHATRLHQETSLCLDGCRATPKPGSLFVSQVCFDRWLLRRGASNLPPSPPPVPSSEAALDREDEAAAQRRQDNPRCAQDGRRLFVEDSAGVRRPMEPVGVPLRTRYETDGLGPDAGSERPRFERIAAEGDSVAGDYLALATDALIASTMKLPPGSTGIVSAVRAAPPPSFADIVCAWDRYGTARADFLANRREEATNGPAPTPHERFSDAPDDLYTLTRRLWRQLLGRHR